MEAAKAGLCDFIVKVSAEYFNLTDVGGLYQSNPTAN
jgi:hypothetical protein